MGKKKPHTQSPAKGEIIWCQVLSTTAYINCTVPGCDNPMHWSRKPQRKRPHSFPRELWDRKRGRIIKARSEKLEEEVETRDSRKTKDVW